MEYERARQIEVEDISSKKKHDVKESFLEFWNWTRRCKCLQLYYRNSGGTEEKQASEK